MKKYSYFLFFFLFGALFVYAKQYDFPFGVGEKIVYRIHKGIVTAGYSTLEVRDVFFPKKGTDYYRFSRGSPIAVFYAEARSSKFVDLIFKVRDKVFSYWDINHKCSLGIEKHLREGFYFKDYRVIFNPFKQVAIYYNAEKKGNPESPNQKPKKNARLQKERGRVSLPSSCIQDGFSLMYYIRSYKGKNRIGSFSVMIHDDKKNVNVKIYVLERREIETDIGRFMALKVKPIITTTGVMGAQRKGDMIVWVSDDEKRIPLRIVLTLKWVGDIYVDIIKYRKGLDINDYIEYLSYED